LSRVMSVTASDTTTGVQFTATSQRRKEEVKWLMLLSPVH